jgi:hypothetical protein
MRLAKGVDYPTDHERKSEGYPRELWIHSELQTSTYGRDNETKVREEQGAALPRLEGVRRTSAIETMPRRGTWGMYPAWRVA